MTNLISIIIPAYNSEKYISNTLDSLCNQNYKDVEIIVVNDGSTDNTINIINDYLSKDSRIKVFTKENGGVSSARLFGISKSKGEWIAFCDSDDTVEADIYTVLLNNAIKYNADISHCGYKMIFPSRVVPYYGTNKLILQNTEKGIIDLLDGQQIEPGLCNKLYKRNILLEFINSDIMDTSIKINEDVLMNFYLFKLASKSVYEDVCLYNYIVHPESAANSTLKEQHLADPLKVNEIILTESLYNYEINIIAKKRYINSLISIATMGKSKNRTLISKYNKITRKKLFTLLFDNLKNNKFSTFYKLKILLATLFPNIYKFIHYIYKKKNGLDKIYEIN